MNTPDAASLKVFGLSFALLIGGQVSYNLYMSQKRYELKKDQSKNEKKKRFEVEREKYEQKIKFLEDEVERHKLKCQVLKQKLNEERSKKGHANAHEL